MSKIGIIGAMELEVEQLKSKMTASNIVTKAGMEFYEGTLNGASVVVVRSGIGKVNAVPILIKRNKNCAGNKSGKIGAYPAVRKLGNKSALLAVKATAYKFGCKSANVVTKLGKGNLYCLTVSGIYSVRICNSTLVKLCSLLYKITHILELTS